MKPSPRDGAPVLPPIAAAASAAWAAPCRPFRDGSEAAPGDEERRHLRNGRVSARLGVWRKARL